MALRMHSSQHPLPGNTLLLPNEKWARDKEYYTGAMVSNGIGEMGEMSSHLRGNSSHPEEYGTSRDLNKEIGDYVLRIRKLLWAEQIDRQIV